MLHSHQEWERRAIGDSRPAVHHHGLCDGVRFAGRDLGGFVEVIGPGRSTHAEDGFDVRALVDHDAAKVLGRTNAGTLRLAKDAHGLRVEIDLPATTYGNDVLESVSRRDVSGMSFSFAVVRPDGERFDRRYGQVTRIITDMLITNQRCDLSSLRSHGCTGRSSGVPGSHAGREVS